MKDRVVTSILALLILLTWSSEGLSLIEGTHQQINEFIGQTSINGFSLNDYLVNNIGLKEGAREIISGVDADGRALTYRVFQWLGYGGFQEDRPGSNLDYVPIVGKPTRSVNHFHNPLRGLWEFSGLNDWLGPLHITGSSSILWAQNRNQDPASKLNGNWSWYDARKYYYTALTGRNADLKTLVVASKEEDRKPYFANTFRALGQLMHLVQDASVPAHVRNQIHIPFHYENWVENIRTKDTTGMFANFIAGPISFDSSILGFAPLDSSASIPIANIVDTDRYSGSNPDVTAGNAIGLSEYTNANFFSEGTIFSNVFLYPNKSSVDKRPYLMMDPRGTGKAVTRDYYVKIRDGETNYRLATVGFLKDYITKYFDLPIRNMDSPALDGGVYNDYAEKLLPRAMGYSTGLLNYFFRGQLNVRATDKKQNGDIEITITNLSDDALVVGDLELY